MPTLGSNLLRFEGSSSPNWPGAPQVEAGPYGLADWYYRNMRDAVDHQQYRASNFLSNCYRNAGSISGRQMAYDAANGALRGGARNAGAATFFRGPQSAAASAARGIVGGALGGAAKSAVRQACFR